MSRYLLFIIVISFGAAVLIKLIMMAIIKASKAYRKCREEKEVLNVTRRYQSKQCKRRGAKR